MLVGGMPQAVNTYLYTQNLSLVDATKREILGLYDEDFYKIDPTGKAASLFKAIPAQLSGNAHRYQITPVVGEVEDTALMTLLHEMEESKTMGSRLPAWSCPARQHKIAGKPPQLFHIIAGTFPQFSYICAE